MKDPFDAIIDRCQEKGSDPAGEFGFDGEFEVSNRGFCEYIDSIIGQCRDMKSPINDADREFIRKLTPDGSRHKHIDLSDAGLTTSFLRYLNGIATPEESAQFAHLFPPPRVGPSARPPEPDADEPVIVTPANGVKVD